MTKTAYTDEEVKKVLQVLLHEKKKVQKLEQQIQDIGFERDQLHTQLNQKTSMVPLDDPILMEKLQTLQMQRQPSTPQDDEQVQKLKKLVIVLKKKLEQTLAQQTVVTKAQAEDLQKTIEKLASYEEENGTLRQRVVRLEQASMERNEEIDANFREIQDLQQNVEHANHQLEESTATIARIEKENALLRGKISENMNRDSEMQQLHQLLEAMKDELNAAKTELATAQDQEKSVVTENAQLSKTQTLLQETLTAVQAELSTAKDDLKKVCQQMDSERSSSQGKLEDIIEEKMRVTEELEQFRAQSEGWQTQISALQAELSTAKDDLKKVCQQMDSERSSSQGKLEDIIGEKMSVSEEFEQFRAQSEGWQTQISNLEQTISTHADVIEEKNQVIAQLEEAVKQLESRCDSSTECVGSYQEQLQQVQESFDSLHNEYNAVKGEAFTLAQKLAAAMKQVSALSAQKTEMQQKNVNIEELDLIKQTLVQGIRQLKEVEARYLDAVNEKVSAMTRSHQISAELDRTATALQTTQKTLSDVEDKLRAATAHSEYLQQSIDNIKAQQTPLENRIASLEEDLKNISEEKNALQNLLDASTTSSSSLQSTIVNLEQQIANFDDEKKVLIEKEEQLATEIDTHLATISGLNNRIEQLQKELSVVELHSDQAHDLQEKYDLLREEFEEQTNYLDEILEGRQKADKKIQEFNDLLQEKEQSLENNTVQIGRLSDIQEKLEADLSEAHSTISSKDSQIKELQQHIKKKVQEVTHLTEKLDESKIQLLQQHNTIDALKVKVEDLETRLNNNSQQEQRLQELLNESIKSAESQVRRWEDKYFRLYDRWQHSESRVKDFQKLESKYNQMQKLLASLGNFIGGPLPFSVSDSEVPLEANDLLEDRVEDTPPLEDNSAAEATFKEAPISKAPSLNELFEISQVKNEQAKKTLF